MDPIRFESRVRYWSPEKASGLAVADIPPAHHAALGGLRQHRVAGTINGAPFTSNVMPAGGGRLALSVSKLMQRLARAGVDDTIDVEITSVGKDAS